jgi:hypothetical protein
VGSHRLPHKHRLEQLESNDLASELRAQHCTWGRSEPLYEMVALHGRLIEGKTARELPSIKGRLPATAPCLTTGAAAQTAWDA